MQGLRFLREEFYFLQHFKRALPIIDKKIRAWKMQGLRFLCEVFFTFYCVLNQSTNHWLKLCAWKMQRFRFLREEFYYLQCSKHAPPIISSIFLQMKDASSSLFMRI